MSEWITDRLPSESDADDIGRVWVCLKGGGVLPMQHDRFEKGLPWQPKEKKPEPYVPPKPERREWKLTPQHENGLTSDETFHSHGYCDPLRALAWPEGEYGFDGYHVREVLPGDIDPDEALAMRKVMDDVAWCLHRWGEHFATQGRPAVEADMKDLAAKLRGEQ